MPKYACTTTRTERLAKIKSKGGLLTEEQKEQAMESLDAGVSLHQTLIDIGAAYHSFVNSVEQDKEFGKLWNEKEKSLSVMVEQMLLGKAMGWTNILTTLKYRRVYDENGRPQNNPDGSEMMCLHELIEQHLPPDNTAIIRYLEAHDKRYCGDLIVKVDNQIEDIRDPKAFTKLLIEKAKKHLKLHQTETERGLNRQTIKKHLLEKMPEHRLPIVEQK